ncbi:P-loop containing nucleoside triphosphate hydrolase protein [Apodospora peruviana]|uniref:DNA repair protein RAD50 n=1 Tax=Apodospora peruviana TaxID=516989 RepID=A0AAE0MEB5_9PEZI|nr:P-loop containing nucleoside triphosphate hydrolase protein [Apodospora peruviana]
MSRIEKLSIMGVRSFGPRHQETITFNTPLTLIVGYNGSGKTTIIECLKYATTGELPPNSKGGAFIHDPNLVGEKDVQAQVKVSFRSTIGESFVVTRNVQLLVKKTTRSQKTLEGSLLLRNNGERHVISTRVMELDKLVPEKLGVSPAVLDAVIFCHQDESLWPMSEPAALKKRFDEIFEAMKYTKVIDNLKSLRKRKGEELRELKLRESQDKANKERADKVDKLLNQLTREIQESRDKCNELLDQMDEETARIKDKYEQANSFLKIVNDLQTKTEKLEYKKDAIVELRSRITEMSEPDQVLKDALDQYERTEARAIAERDQKTGQIRDLQAELKRSRGEHTAKASEQGRHQSDKDKYDRQLIMRSRMIQDAADRHEIRGYDGELDDRQIHAFYERIQKILSDKKRELERLQRDNSATLDEKTAVITERESRKASRTRDRALAKQRMGTVGKDITNIQSELNQLDIDEGAEALLRTEMKELEARIDTAKVEEQAADLDAQIQKVNDDILNLEALSAKLSRELVDCTRLASERAQLDLRKKQLTERRRDLDILINTWNLKLSAILGDGWQPETIEVDFQDAIKRQNKVVIERRKQKDTTQQELKQLQFQLSSARERKGKLSAEKELCERAVVKAIKQVNGTDSAAVDEYTSVLESLEKDLKTVEQDLSLYDHLKNYYLKAQDKVTKYNKCHLCDRDFIDNLSAKSKLMAKIGKMISDDDKEVLIADQVGFSEMLKGMRAVQSNYEAHQRLDQEIPHLAQDIVSLGAQKEQLVRRLEDQDLVFKEAEDKQQEIDALSKNVLKISQTYKDIVDSERQIERSQQSSTLAVRSAEEINAEQTNCAEQMRVAQTKLSKLSADRQRMRDHAAQLEVEKMELRHKISNAVQQLERKKRLQGTIQKYKEEQSQLRESIQAADRDLESLEPEIASARTALEEARQQSRTREQKVAEERDGIATTVSELKMINTEIQDYLDRGGPSNLASNKRAIATLETSIANLENEIRELTVQINKMSKEIDNSDAKKRNISDNLTYRKNLRERDALEGEIEELESRNAQEDYDRLVKEARFIESRRGKLGADRERLMGSMSTKDEQFARLNEEYEIDLKGAKAKYKESHIKVETTKAAIDDLGRGTAALDHAIMQYHSLKMEEINRTVGELWQSTYQGTDIDTIQIRSDVETGTTAAGASKRTYNYRVSMVKGDTEMDMRGRCSAGQKVLASIIIRLALAESFGVNCGLIALDEPTTNLDSDNIRSLGESLHAIIKARQSQSNLQLIVITHDEEFLKHMQCSDFCDDFFRVKRDERQNSVIVRESITRITE